MRSFLITILAVLFALVIFSLLVDDSDAHVWGSCTTNECKHHVIKPYEMGFLRYTGHCESRSGYSYGSRHGELKTGLTAVSPGGTYRGRYQFGWDDWARAGGSGDPARASWLEQAYRAILWLHKNGRQSWPNC